LLAYQRRLELDESALACLAAHPWPGNVRQLHNVVERLVLLAEGPVVRAADVAPLLDGETAVLSPALRMPASPAGPGAAAVSGRGIDAGAIDEALAVARGNKSRAAQALGLTLRQLDYRLRKLKVPDA